MTDDTGKSKDATRRTVLLGFGGAVGAAFATDAPPAAAQMAQGHREVRPGTPPLAEIRVIERSNLLSGRLAGLLLADQGAEVFVERAGATPAADQRVALDDAYFDRGKIALPPGAAADGASADIVIVDGAAQVARAPHQILLRIMAALPGDEVYGHLPHDCSEDLIKAVVGFFTNMSVSGPILNRPVIYTPLPLPSVYCAVNGAVAAVSAFVDRLRTGLGREIIASRLAGGLSAIGALSMTSKGLPDFLEPIVIGGLPPGIDAGTIPHLRRRRDPRSRTADVARTALCAVLRALPRAGRSMDSADGRPKRAVVAAPAGSHGAVGPGPRHRRGLRQSL